MATAIEQRIYERKDVSEKNENIVIFDAPTLSGEKFTPKDISLGGLMIESSVPLEVCDTIECSIQIGSDAFMDCEATVAWKTGNEAAPSVWQMGFLLRVPENRRNDYEAAIEAAFPSEEKVPSRV